MNFQKPFLIVFDTIMFIATQIKVGVFIVDANNRLLLIKEKVSQNDKPLWNIIKGTYGDTQETETVFLAAQRECKEEASVGVKLLKSAGCYLVNEGDKLKIQFNFIAQVEDGTPMVAHDDIQKGRNEQILEIRWFTREDVIGLKEAEFISTKIYLMVQDWLKGLTYPLDTIKIIEI